jgi:DNA topoisomerase VI subunit A
MAIMLCYRFGSKTMPEANAFIVPLRWLGVHHDDVERFSLPASALQDLAAVDEAKAASLARDPAVAADPLLAYEVAQFLEEAGASSGGAAAVGCHCPRRVKMEIEGVLGRGMRFLADEYLPAKIMQATVRTGSTQTVAAAVRATQASHGRIGGPGSRAITEVEVDEGARGVCFSD